MCVCVCVCVYLFSVPRRGVCFHLYGEIWRSTTPVKYKWDRESFFTHIEAPNGGN